MDFQNQSEEFDKAKNLSNKGIEVGEVKLNLPKLMKNKDKAVTVLTKGVEFLFKKNKVTYFKGTGSFKSKNEIIKSLAFCSGHTGIAGGQELDLKFENKKKSLKQIMSMQKKKTGELFGFCCESIAIIKGMNFVKRKKLKEIGMNIGLLFQTVDDLIDYSGDSLTVGKPTKRDKKKGKATLVNLLGYKKTIIFAKDLKKRIESEIKNSLKMKILKKAAFLQKTKPKDFERNSKADIKVQ